MRIKLTLAALLCTVAMPAHAGPVMAFTQALWVGLTAASVTSAAVAGAIGGVTAAGYAVGSFLGGSILGRFILSMGLNAIASKLMARSIKPSEAMTNYAQAVSYMQRGYGVCRVGGVYGFTGFKAKKRHYTILIAAHSTVGPLEHWLSDREVEVAGNAFTALTAAVHVFSENQLLSGEAVTGSTSGSGGGSPTYTANSRVLLVGQTNAAQNGLWITSGAAWSRPADFNSGTTISGWVSCTGYVVNMTGVVIGTSAQTWTESDGLPGEILTGDMKGKGSVRPFTGQAGQTADPVFVAAFPEITTAFDFAGLSGAHLWAKRVSADDLQDVYPDGDVWIYAPVWKMHDRIYDPRTGTYGWTDNAALIIAHEIVHYLGAEVDWSEIAEEAAICDQLVTNREGATQKRWTINRSYTDDQEWETIRAELITACDGFIYERPDGKVGLKVGRYIAPTVTLTAEDFLSLTVESGEDLGSNTQYVVQYTEPLNKYYETPTGTYVYDAGARRVTSETAAYAINSHNQACRVVKRIARVEHAAFKISGTIKLIGFECIGQRFVNFVHEEMGISCVMEIGKLVASDNGLTFEVQGASVTADDFAFVAATEEPERPSYDTVESDDDVDDLTGLTAQVIDSNGSASILVKWDSQDGSYHQQLRVRSPDAGIDDWQIITLSSGSTGYVATGLVDGAQYQVQGRNRTSAGRPGEWKPEAPVVVIAIANTTAPGALSGFGAGVIGSDVALSWTAPNDEAYFATRIWRRTYTSAPGAPAFSGASAIHTEYGIASDADAYTDLGPGAGYHYYWAEAINSSGLAGPRSGPVEIIIS